MFGQSGNSNLIYLSCSFYSAVVVRCKVLLRKLDIALAVDVNPGGSAVDGFSSQNYLSLHLAMILVGGENLSCSESGFKVLT